ncbi:MAG: division/cell wall cluster transcriptional repressor MraZ [Candidatus Caldatribacterium sp.]|nr:division/cell wall cluster transcriptional repressor MraZ [Candidatus Caldatribacterium sp.]
MFVGQYSHNVDEKGRIIIPSAFREELQGTLYLSRGIERCIFLYPESSWKSLYEKITSLSLTRKETRDFARLFLSTVAVVTPDSQGRISLPAYLREYAAIDRRVVLIGVGTRVEIWDEELWREYTGTTEERFAEICERIVDTGI